MSLKSQKVKASKTKPCELLAMIYSRVPFVLCCECTHFIGNHLPHFLNSYPVLFHSSNTFLVSFPLSGCPSPLHHLVNSSHVHLKGHLHYEPFPDPPCILSSLAPTSHSKQSVSPSSAPLAPYLDFIITLCCNCWFPPLLNGKLFGVFSPLVYYSTLAHNRCSKNSQRRRKGGREGEKQNLSLLMAESPNITPVSSEDLEAFYPSLLTSSISRSLLPP